MFSKNLSCGEGEIRTLDRLTPTPVFETGSFNHSDTSPSVNLKIYVPNLGKESLKCNF
jgi:hypothetical protein